MAVTVEFAPASHGRTVKHHLRRISDKLPVANRVELADTAVQWPLVEPTAAARGSVMSTFPRLDVGRGQL